MKKFLTTCQTLAAATCVATTASLAGAQDLGVKAPPQENPVILVGTVHTVSDGTIENGMVMFDDSVITTVGDAEMLQRMRLTEDSR